MGALDVNDIGSIVVREYNSINSLNIELHHLLPYSPNLNSIERIGKVMNEVVRNNRYFASPKEFRQGIHHFFSEKLPVLAGALSCCINDNFQTLVNASSS